MPKPPALGSHWHRGYPEITPSPGAIGRRLGAVRALTATKPRGVPPIHCTPVTFFPFTLPSPRPNKVSATPPPLLSFFSLSLPTLSFSFKSQQLLSISQSQLFPLLPTLPPPRYLGHEATLLLPPQFSPLVKLLPASRHNRLDT